MPKYAAGKPGKGGFLTEVIGPVAWDVFPATLRHVTFPV
jgi:hypothetical protein